MKNISESASRRARSLYADSFVGRNWLFGRFITAEVAERQRRETKISEVILEDEDEVHDTTNDTGLLLRLISYILPYHGKVVLAIGLMLGTSLLTVARPWIVGI